MDALDVLEIAMDIEEKINIAITDQELDALQTFQDLLDLLVKKNTPREALEFPGPKDTGPTA